MKPYKFSGAQTKKKEKKKEEAIKTMYLTYVMHSKSCVVNENSEEIPTSIFSASICYYLLHFMIFIKVILLYGREVSSKMNCLVAKALVILLICYLWLGYVGWAGVGGSGVSFKDQVW